MPSLADLLKGDPNFNYYHGGHGNFIQKDIPFGNDRPHGDSSNQPFVVTKEGQQWSPDNADDGVIRFGGIGVITRTTADVARMTKFFGDPVKGQQFLAKQVGLQLSNPQLEMRAGQTTPAGDDSIMSQLSGLPKKINDTFGPTRIYNLGLNTLAQVGVNAIGGHFYRNGLSPIMDDNDKYYAVVKDNNTYQTDTVNIDSGNRLVSLQAKMFGDDRTLYTYKGGPGSVYGIGQTVIKSFTDTLSDSNSQTAISSFVPLKPSDLAKIGRDGVYLQVNGPDPNNMMANEFADTATTNPDGQVSYDFKTMDFRLIKNALYNAGLNSTDYTKYNLNTRIGTGNPGVPGLDRSKNSNVLPGTQDLINKLSLFYAKDPPQSDSSIHDLNSGDNVTPESVRDMIKFRFEDMDNDNPDFSLWMVFRAFIQGDIDDSFSAEWESYKYTGRGERFYTYNGYTRQVNLTFVIAARTRQEMKPLYQKLNYLMSTMAPDYNGANKMRGNIIKLTIGDYLYRQPGVITGLNIRIPQDAQWEIAIDEPEGGDDSVMHEVPMLLQVSLTFLPIQDFLPRKGASTPFISVNGRKSPSDPQAPPSKNNWFADSPVFSNQDGTKKYVPLQKKVAAARKASQS